MKFFCRKFHWIVNFVVMGFVLVSATSALTPPDISILFSCKEGLPKPGDLLHYRVEYNNLFSLPNEKDYWVYWNSDGSLETLYSGEILGEDTVCQDVWLVNRPGLQFARHYHHDLASGPGKPTVSSDSLFDTKAKTLRTQTFATDVSNRTQTVSNCEDIRWEPTLWHQDLGIWFITFLPQLNPDAGPFTICLNSYSHLILMTVRYEKTETVSGIICRKYVLEGQGLLSGVLHGGAVWVSVDERSKVVAQELNVRLSWALSHIRMDLVETKTLSADKWKSLQATFKTP